MHYHYDALQPYLVKVSVIIQILCTIWWALIIKLNEFVCVFVERTDELNLHILNFGLNCVFVRVISFQLSVQQQKAQQEWQMERIFSAIALTAALAPLIIHQIWHLIGTKRFILIANFLMIVAWILIMLYRYVTQGTSMRVHVSPTHCNQFRFLLYDIFYTFFNITNFSLFLRF